MRTLFNTIIAFMLALSVGLGTAWYMIAEGSPLTTRRIGPWTVWHSAGNPDPDPYTRAYQARTGRLPITSTNALYYYARTDDAGEELRSECDYVVEGQPINAPWWSMALYDEEGRLIPNKANRYAFNRTDLIRRTDGTFQVMLAQNAREGNWLPTGEGRLLQLTLRVYSPRNFNDAVKGRLLERRLPTITKAGCR